MPPSKTEERKIQREMYQKQKDDAWATLIAHEEKAEIYGEASELREEANPPWDHADLNIVWIDPDT